MGFETLILAREESYAVVTLNRPPANAINETLMRELNAALTSVQTESTARSNGTSWTTFSSRNRSVPRSSSSRATTSRPR